ncbi:60S ribosomal protein L23 [Zea mays]|nr:60S ribosomal protein L23 [Zea mays]ONM08684.1 60S ribosomal protein L23 [Zea mays]ONM21684.1 60S ribosomal protein L23 [Zea mays]
MIYGRVDVIALDNARQRGGFLHNAGVIVNPKGDMKGFAITGPIDKECANL